MRTRGRNILAAVLLAAGVAGAREWTSVSGATVEAEFIRVTGEIVVLRTADGQMLSIRRSLLSAEDRAHIDELTGPPAAPQQAQVPAAGPAARGSGSDGIVLSREEEAALNAEFTDPRSGDRYTFMVGARVDRNASRNRNWREGQPISVRITADCMRLRQMRGGETRRQRENGPCHVYLLDENAEPVLSRSSTIAAMCPT